MTTFTRGQKGKLADLGVQGRFAATIEIVAASMTVDLSCFGLDANGKLADDRFMLFYNQKSAPDEAIVFEPGAAKSVFRIDLERLPAAIDKLVFTASTDQGTMHALGPCALSLDQALTFPFSGADFEQEKAVIVAELYRRDGSWRFGAVGQGFAGGLSALLQHFGGTELKSVTNAAPVEKKISLSKIRLEKTGDKVSLEKREGQDFGRIHVNLNWNQQGGASASASKDDASFIGKLFGRSEPKAKGNAIDLDVGCLYELANGARGAVQALGNSWGSFTRPPYIHLEGDDRTGAMSSGENIYINGQQFDHVRRVLVYAFIYEGVPNWAATDGVVTIEMPGQPPVEVRLDGGAKQSMCAVALIENQAGKLQVTKLAEYFGGHGAISAHQEMDERYSFGLNWKTGSKS